MKILLIIAFLLSIPWAAAFPQADSLREIMTSDDSLNNPQTEKVQLQAEKPDSLICGKEYRIRAINGWKGKAVLIAQDSLTITIRLGHKNFKISRDQISEMVTSDKHFKNTVHANPVSLGKCDISLIGGKVIKGALIKNLSQDTLVIINKSADFRIPADSITSIVFPKESNAFIIGLGGAVVCGLGTYLIMEMSRPEFKPTTGWLGGLNVTFGNLGYNISELYTSIGVGILGGLASGLIAGSVSADEEYVLSGMDKETKLYEIRNIIEGTD